MRRIMYLWLPRWPIDRLRLSSLKNSGWPVETIPFATVADAAGRRLLAAVSPAATAAGLVPGMPLADALSFFPGLATTAAKPAEDAAALRRLVEWCGRYSPWTAPDGTDGIRIDITGSAHLWGGRKTARCRSLGAARTPAYCRAHRDSRHARCCLGDGPLCGSRPEPRHSAAGLSRRPRPIASGGAPPRSNHHSGAAAGRLETGRRSLRHAARRACPPVWGDGGETTRSGTR